MAIDPRFIPAFSIETVILDKDTGAPLSGGLVYFEKDNQRGVLKPVYQITGTSPAYTYTQLPNPMTLSSIGTFEDALGNPVVPYFYPYDDINTENNPDYYFVNVTSSDGIEQFVRQAVPYVSDIGEDSVESTLSNQISNPQFGEVLFDTSTATFTYNFTSVTNQVVNLAPDWDLIVTCPSSGTVVVTQLKPTGSLNIVTNPVTLLTIQSTGISKLLLRQRLFGSPNLWGNGYLSGGFVAKTYSGTNTNLSMYYSQSGGTVINQLIVAATLPSSGNYAYYAKTISLPISNNTQTFPGAYVDIYFDIPVSIKIDITSIMVAGTDQDRIEEVVYEQIPLARQKDHLFHYYEPSLIYKPIPSYLIGWDFVLNPAQLGSTMAPVASGANKSYASNWDQTVIFQTVNSALNISRNVGTSGLVITAAASTSFSVIQYLPQQQARDLAGSGSPLSAQLKSYSSQAIKASVSCYYTTGASLPDLKSPNFNSLVTSISSAVPTVGSGGANGNWIKLNYNKPGDAIVNIAGLSSASTPFNLSSFGPLASYPAGATYFAVVVTYDVLGAGQSVYIDWCSLNAGTIPTRPAPQTPDEVLRQCEYYYENSYPVGVVPGTVVASPFMTRMSSFINGSNFSSRANNINIPFLVPKRAIPLVQLYSPATLNAAGYIRSYLVNGAHAPPGLPEDTIFDARWTKNATTMGYYAIGTAAEMYAGAAGDSNPQSQYVYVNYHYTADARLGIVL